MTVQDTRITVGPTGTTGTPAPGAAPEHIVDDAVTGAQVVVELRVDVAAGPLWDVITDVTRIGEFSPECKAAHWLDESAPGPRPGARFQGRNEFPDNPNVGVVCLVTEARRPAAFGWSVLDAEGDPEAPSSRWHYELAPGAEEGTTVVRHSFTHGSGDSGARRAAQEDPAALRERLDQLRAHMTVTLRAMAAAASSPGSAGHR